MFKRHELIFALVLLFCTLITVSPIAGASAAGTKKTNIVSSCSF